MRRFCTTETLHYCLLCWLLLLTIGNGAFTKAANLSSKNQNISKPQAPRAPRAQAPQAPQAQIVLMSNTNDNGDNNNDYDIGKLEELKLKEAELSKLLADIRREKLSVIRSRPLTIGIVGFGRFGQFIGKTFAKYGNVVATSRSDYSAIANRMGVTYIPMDDLDSFFAEGLDVIVVATSIMSFDSTLRNLIPHIEKDIQRRNGRGPLVVDVLSVKEHARELMLQLLPPQCDILCTHPMFGPDSGKDSWNNLNFVYEKTRVDSVILDPCLNQDYHHHASSTEEQFVDCTGTMHSIHENSEGHIEGMDRMSRFLSIWEEEGCRMVQMSCKDHDAYAANSQFITHLMGRILGSQGLSNTPIDTKGFESVLQLIHSTTADSFDLFYGLYKYNQNSADTIMRLKLAMDDVVHNLKLKEGEEQQNGNKHKMNQQQQQQQQQEVQVHADTTTTTYNGDDNNTQMAFS